MVIVAVVLMMLTLPAAGLAAGQTWYVTRPGDGATDGDLAARRGTLRFVLTHATAGDFVSFTEFPAVADKIYAGSPLVVPDGVAVGSRPDQGCGDYTRPFVIIEALNQTVNPVMSLGAGASLRGINIGRGDVSLRVDGASAEVCGMGLGVEYDEDGVLITLPPWHAALIVDAPAASIHSSFINGAIVVSTRGSLTRIGDSLTGTGEGNRGGCGNQGKCPVTIMADTSAAARQVTLRDPFPRSLQGMAGSGVFGGDDVPNHANHWAQTPTILSAVSYDNFATVQVTGIANPSSLVDLFYNDGISLSHQSAVIANASGAFSFTGDLPGHAVDVFAISTLMDPAYPDRAGSSSELSVAVPVTAATSPTRPTLNVSASAANLSRPGVAGVSAGERLRLSVLLVNTGAVSVTQIASNGLVLPTGIEAVPGSGVVTGGSGFIAGDRGFTGGVLLPTERATYALDLNISSFAHPGHAVIALEVGGDGLIMMPVVARFEVLTRWLFPLVRSNGP